MLLDIEETISSYAGQDFAELKTIEPKRSQSRIPVVASLLVSVVAGVLALVAWNSANESEQVVVASSDLIAGAELVESDLTLISASGVNNAFASKDDLIGQIVQHGVAAGDLIQASDLGETRLIGEGLTVVGVLAGPGTYPTPNIGAGDVVDVFGVDPETQRSTLIASEVIVYNVTSPDFQASSDLLISVEVSPVAAAKIATANLTPDGIRFALRGG